MKTKPASVSDMLRKLGEKEVIEYRKYYGLQITESGKRFALQTIRKHRLWEVFLVEKLQFAWDEVHEVAEQLEHIQSPFSFSVSMPILIFQNSTRMGIRFPMNLVM